MAVQKSSTLNLKKVVLVVFTLCMLFDKTESIWIRVHYYNEIVFNST